MKKSLIAFLLCLCVLLTACGGADIAPTIGNTGGSGNSGKVKPAEVTAMIDALGQITAESYGDILAAEEAYEQLTAGQKKKVENYDALVAAKEECLKLAIIGQWSEELSASNLWADKNMCTFSEDGTCVINAANMGWTQEGTWTLRGGKLITTYTETWSDEWTIVEEDGKLRLHHDYYDAEHEYYCPVAENQARWDEIFVTVDLENADLKEYFGFGTRVEEAFDAWGDPTGEKTEYLYLTYKLQENMYFWDASDDIMYEINTPEYTHYYSSGEEEYSYIVDPTTELAYDPIDYSWHTQWVLSETGPEYSARNEIDRDAITFGRARGTLTYIKSEYVKEVRVEDDMRVTVVVLDGIESEYWSTYRGYMY